MTNKGLPVLYLQVNSVKDYLDWHSNFNIVKLIVQEENYALIKYKDKSYIYIIEIKD